MKKLLNNATRTLVIMIVAPIALLFIAAILTVAGPVLKQVGGMIATLWKLTFPTFGTGVMVFLLSAYHFILGFVAAVAVHNKREREKKVESIDDHKGQKAA